MLSLTWLLIYTVGIITCKAMCRAEVRNTDWTAHPGSSRIICYSWFINSMLARRKQTRGKGDGFPYVFTACSLTLSPTLVCFVFNTLQLPFHLLVTPFSEARENNPFLSEVNFLMHVYQNLAIKIFKATANFASIHQFMKLPRVNS